MSPRLPHLKPLGEREGGIAFRSAVVEWKSISACHAEDPVLSPAAEEFLSWGFRIWENSCRARRRKRPAHELLLRDDCIFSGVAQWFACWAHNPEVRVSKPRSAMSNALTMRICLRRGREEKQLHRYRPARIYCPRTNTQHSPVAFEPTTSRHDLAHQPAHKNASPRRPLTSSASAKRGQAVT